MERQELRKKSQWIVQRNVSITISNSQGLWLGLSLRSTPQYLWVMGVYIMWVKKVCIRYDCSAKQNVSREGLTHETLAKTNSHHPVMTLRIPVMCWAHASLHEKASHELPAKTSLVFNCLFTLSLSHTTLTMKSHIKYKVQKIEHNYNQIWHGIKANTKQL